jgi:hypothetical protein
MPQIPTKIMPILDEPEEGKTYQITEANYKEVTTQESKKFFSGVEVKLALLTKGKPAPEPTNKTMLFYGEKMAEGVGPHSKIGSFITQLGDNTDTWPGQTIQIIKWKAKHRSILLVQK